MIIKEDKTIETETNSSVKDTEVVMSAKKSNKLFAILLESYKNPRASLVREYTSNAWDAQQQNGKTNVPVIVQIDEDEGGKYIQFIDEGVGMSFGFFNRVYSKLLESTKEDSNDEIGGFGIGSKSALAYTDYYHVETTKNGRYNHFVIYKESNSSIKITRITSKKVIDANTGTKVKVYFKENNQNEEERLFEDICVKELCYFDNVILRFKNNTNKASTYNYYKIIEADTFKYKSGYNYEDNIHLVLGKVAYPIDYRELGLQGYHYGTAVALKFEIGELNVHMNRETVLYSDNAKKLIKQKLDECVKELIIRYNNQNKPVVDYVTYLSELNREKNTSSKSLKIDSVNTIFIYGEAIVPKLTNVKFAPSLLLGFKESPNVEEVIPFLRVTHRLSNGKAVRTSHSINLIANSNTLVFYKDKEPFNSKEFMTWMEDAYFVKVDKYYAQQDYMSNKFKALTKSLLKTVKKRKCKENRYNGVYQFDEYVTIESSLGIGKRFLAYRREIMSQIKNRFVRIIDYDKFEIPLEWKEEQKAIRREARVKIERAQGIIPSRQVNLTYGSMFSKDLDLSTLHDFRGLIIYGFQENKDELLKVWKILRINENMYDVDTEGIKEKSLLIIQIARNNVKSMQGFKNAVHVNTFLRSQNRVIVRIYTAYKIRVEFGKLLNNDTTLQGLNSKIAKDMGNMRKYCYNSSISIESAVLAELIKELDVMNSIIPMFDKNIVREFEDCKRYFKNLTLFKNIDISSVPFDSLVELLKANGKLLNYNYYNKAKVIPIAEIQKQYRLVERPMYDLREYTPRPQVIS